MGWTTSRRQFISITGAAAAASTLTANSASAVEKKWQQGKSPWPLSLDTSTIRPAALEDKIRIAAETGYDAIEPWTQELAEYEENGGNLEDLGKRIADNGLFVHNVIGLWNCMPPTQEEWEASLENTRNYMRISAAIGAKMVQAVPGPNRKTWDIDWCSARFRDLIQIGRNDYNIIPSLVFLQFFPGMRTVGHASAVALNADDPDASIILDTFHMYTGGSGYNCLKHIDGDFIGIFQFNDAPPAPGLGELEDKHRVFPGDGVLPLTDILRDLYDSGYTRPVSLELYNPTYWERNLQEVAAEGREKTLAVIETALA